MRERLLSYRVIVEPDERTGTGEKAFSAYCPTLDVVSEGETLEEALKNIKEAISLRLEGLVERGQPIPQDRLGQEKIVHTSVPVPKGAQTL